MQVLSPCSRLSIPKPTSWQRIISGYQQIRDRKTICDESRKVGAILEAQPFATESKEFGRWQMEESAGRLKLNNPKPY